MPFKGDRQPQQPDYCLYQFDNKVPESFRGWRDIQLGG